MEEVVGLGLLLYVEEGRKPGLEDGYEREGRERDIRLSTVGWGLRIVEDDGEVDEDFPGQSRHRVFYAGIELTLIGIGWTLNYDSAGQRSHGSQVFIPRVCNHSSHFDPKYAFFCIFFHSTLLTFSFPTNIVDQNLLKTPIPVRTASTTQVNGTNPTHLTAQASTTGVPARRNSFMDTGPSDDNLSLKPIVPGIPVLLKVTVVNTADIRFITTISVLVGFLVLFPSRDGRQNEIHPVFCFVSGRTSATYLADVVELVYKKKRMSDGPRDWVLCLADLSFILPLDRTVESLMGVTSLCMVRRSWAASHNMKGGVEKGGDPNGLSLFHCQVL